MPICGFVRKFEIVSHPEYSDCLRVSIWYSGSTPEVFSELLGETFPNVGISSERSRKKRFLVHGDVEHIVVNKNNRKLVKSLENLLKVFGRCITIEDGLDESHALSPHSPKNEDDEFYRSKVGTLVNQAKDYTRRQPFQDRPATQQLVARVMNFIDKHPRYRRANAIAFAPSSNPSTTQTLPSTVARVIAKELRKPLISPVRKVAIPSQKDYEESEAEKTRSEVQLNTVQITRPIRGEKIVIIDDLYETGSTMGEVARALRDSGATEVLGLTFTKNARGTQGMDLRSWPWG